MVIYSPEQVHSPASTSTGACHGATEPTHIARSINTNRGRKHQTNDKILRVKLFSLYILCCIVKRARYVSINHQSYRIGKNTAQGPGGCSGIF